VTALVMCHCESVDSGLLDTNLESFDRHFAVNARASWLLIREFGRRFRGPHGTGRIISLTSDATVGNLPYGASKAALDRITLAAARELEHLGVTANAINPGPVDTGWMPTTCGSTSCATHRWAASAPRKTPPAWSSSSALRRAAGSTASSS
jgi:3-oxoacyl-[acyl-carrier protein] reductase